MKLGCQIRKIETHLQNKKAKLVYRNMKARDSKKEMKHKKEQKSKKKKTKENDNLFCFCCTLFSKRKMNLTSLGLTDWKNANSLLRSYDSSSGHLYSVKMWKDLAVRIIKWEDEKLSWRALMWHVSLRCEFGTSWTDGTIWSYNAGAN